MIWIRNVKALVPVGSAAWLSGTLIVWDIGMEKRSHGIVRLLHALGFRMASAVVVQGGNVFHHTFPETVITRFSWKCHVIPSGLGPELSSRLEHARLRPRAEDEFIILCSGTLCRRKNQGMLLEAVEPLLDAFPRVSVLFAGSESEPAYAENLRTRYSHRLRTGRVRFL